MNANNVNDVTTAAAAAAAAAAVAAAAAAMSCHMLRECAQWCLCSPSDVRHRHISSHREATLRAWGGAPSSCAASPRLLLTKLACRGGTQQALAEPRPRSAAGLFGKGPSPPGPAPDRAPLPRAETSPKQEDTPETQLPDVLGRELSAVPSSRGRNSHRMKSSRVRRQNSPELLHVDSASVKKFQDLHPDLPNPCDANYGYWRLQNKKRQRLRSVLANVKRVSDPRITAISTSKLLLRVQSPRVWPTCPR